MTCHEYLKRNLGVSNKSQAFEDLTTSSENIKMPKFSFEMLLDFFLSNHALCNYNNNLCTF